MTLSLAVTAIAISAAFPGGSIGRVEHVAPDHLRCAVKGQADQNNRNRQANWYYFRIDNLPRKKIRIDFTDLVGEYNFRPGSHAVTRNTRPVFSYDNRTWTHFTDNQVSWDEKEVSLTVQFVPAHSTMWIAHMESYGQRELDRLLAIKHPHIQSGVAGKTVRGREIRLLTVTDPGIPEDRKKVVWLLARQHAWEAGTSWAADGAIRFLLSKDPEAVGIRRSTVFQVIPLFDGDGVAEGAVRFNVNGYDNNRNWDTAEPEAMPEISSVRKTLSDWLDAGHPIHVLVSLHDTESTDYLEAPTADPKVQTVALRLASQLRNLTDFYDPKSPRTSTAEVDRGRYTVYQYFCGRHTVPAFLLELMVERQPRLGRPRTAEDFVKFGTGLARSLARAASGE
ncbi:MAG: M14-type cytosolic carboxypeptidase [Bryobacteraceae bacterium]